ncbi:divergent AAA domain protein [Ancylostoma caninum]|uniref:Divergent AAA domain protein n=1 Tax=Ancylostoma caninum TaxID=29170 RepID=A0A368FUS1_ANCCA|nr:divergent AAA domain protein [Ancylostoma caninum]
MGTRRIRVGERCLLDEDMHTEFKMHTKHSLMEIPARCQTYDRGRPVRTMQPTSKTISAFLNTEGGTIYIGIGDSAVIYGIRLTAPMKDHFIFSLNHCISQFNPPVPPELVQVQFVEIEEIACESPQNAPAQAKPASLSSGDVAGDDDDDSEAEFQRMLTKVHQSPDGTIYQNEEGLAYRRRHGSNQMMTINDINVFMHNDRIVDLEETSNQSLFDRICNYLRIF